MTNLNPVGAAQRMLDNGTNTRGECLVAVGAAVLDGKPVLDHALTAAIAWADAGAAHHHTSNAPVDYPWFLGGAGGSGDVVLSTGDGVHCIASDYSTGGVIHWGRIGVMTLADRVRQVGGPLLGWSDLFLGYTLTGLDPSGGGTVTPIQETAMPQFDLLVNPSDLTHYVVVSAGVPLVVSAAVGQALAAKFNLSGLQCADFGLPATPAGWQQLLGMYCAPAVTAGSGGSGASQAQVQAVSDQSDKNIAAMFTQLATLLNTDVQTLLNAIAAIPVGATEAQTATLISQAVSDIIAKIPTKLTV